MGKCKQRTTPKINKRKILPDIGVTDKDGIAFDLKNS